MKRHSIFLKNIQEKKCYPIKEVWGSLRSALILKPSLQVQGAKGAVMGRSRDSDGRSHWHCQWQCQRLPGPVEGARVLWPISLWLKSQINPSVSLSLGITLFLSEPQLSHLCKGCADTCLICLLRGFKGMWKVTSRPARHTSMKPYSPTPSLRSRQWCLLSPWEK